MSDACALRPLSSFSQQCTDVNRLHKSQALSAPVWFGSYASFKGSWSFFVLKHTRLTLRHIDLGTSERIPRCMVMIS